MKHKGPRRPGTRRRRARAFQKERGGGYPFLLSEPGHRVWTTARGTRVWKKPSIRYKPTAAG